MRSPVPNTRSSIAIKRQVDTTAQMHTQKKRQPKCMGFDSSQPLHVAFFLAFFDFLTLDVASLGCFLVVLLVVIVIGYRLCFITSIVAFLPQNANLCQKLVIIFEARQHYFLSQCVRAGLLHNSDSTERRIFPEIYPTETKNRIV